MVPAGRSDQRQRISGLSRRPLMASRTSVSSRPAQLARWAKASRSSMMCSTIASRPLRPLRRMSGPGADGVEAAGAAVRAPGAPWLRLLLVAGWQAERGAEPGEHDRLLPGFDQQRVRAYVAAVVGHGQRCLL